MRNPLNRRMRTRMYGDVTGADRRLSPLCPFSELNLGFQTPVPGRSKSRCAPKTGVSEH